MTSKQGPKYLKRIERVAKTGAHGVHGSKIIFTPRIPDKRCSCLLPSHSAAKYILGPNPSSLSRPHPCLLPLPPFSRWRRGFQARPGTSPRRGRLSLASASAPPPSPSFPAVAARLPGEAGHGAPARPPLGAAATRRGGAPRGGGHSREHAPAADAGLGEHARLLPIPPPSELRAWL